MVGNDIVDLGLAKKESDWERPRFLEKLFTEKEQKMIYGSKNPFVMVWRLWSMKEAAYKLYIQIYPGRFYRPNAFHCHSVDGKSKVSYNTFNCFVETKMTSGYVLSEARLRPFKMNSKVLSISDAKVRTQSETIKKALIEDLSQTHTIPDSELQFYTSEFGIPKLYFNTRKFNVSLSHHGHFGAYAYEEAPSLDAN